MIDRQLNYGRDNVRRFLEGSAPYSRVLDLGAGWGDDLLAAREIQPAADLLAVELNPPYVAGLEQRGITVMRLDLECDGLPLDDGSIDVVIANQILEHTKEIFWILHQVSRVLRLGGSLILGVPNLASLHNRVLLGLGRQPASVRVESAHIRGYTRTGMMAFLEAGFPAGYRLVEFAGSNFYPFPPSLARPAARLLPGMSVGIFFSLVKEREYESGFADYPSRDSLETAFKTS